MNAVRIGLITLCAAASVGAWLSLRDTQPPEAPAPQATRARMNPFAASTPGSSAHLPTTVRNAQRQRLR